MSAKGGECRTVTMDNLTLGKGLMISDVFERNLGIGLSLSAIIRRAIDCYMWSLRAELTAGKESSAVDRGRSPMHCGKEFCGDKDELKELIYEEFERVCWCCERNPRDLMKLDLTPKVKSRKSKRGDDDNE